MKYSEVFTSHRGKYSDKWSQYLDVYDRVLQDLPNPKSILEIGVQNGGSLEIWDTLYPDADFIIGIDVDKKCSDLEFQSSKIKVLVGDAKSDETIRQALEIVNSFDIVIDDGSHTSEDIIVNLIKLLPTLKPGAIYLIEDLHASYWDSFGGSLFGSETAMAFLKRLADALNRNYWNQNFTHHDLFDYGDIKLTNEFILAVNQIAEIRFFDSISVLHMSKDFKDSQCQIRISAGKEALINPEPTQQVGAKLSHPAEKRDPDLVHGRLTTEEFLAMRRQLRLVLESRSWKWTAIIRKLTSRYLRS